MLKKMDSIVKLFDLDKDEKIGRNDMKFVLITQICLKHGDGNYSLNEKEKKEIDKELEKLFSIQDTCVFLMA